MGFVLSLGSIKMNLLPEEAFNACTINAAHAIEIANEVGSIAIGKRANFLITDLPSLDALPYHFAENRIDEVWVNGVQVSY
jgi:imidazolonepropionase